MSVTRFNQNGTVSVVGLTRTEYDAINAVLFAAGIYFDNQGKENKDKAFYCVLTREEMQALRTKSWKM